MNIVLLSGGSGKRLWPLSNETMSKQFLRILNNEYNEKESMIQRIYRQIKEMSVDANIVIATSALQVESIRNQLGENVDIVVEPERRNTFPAILLASAYLKIKKHVSDNESIIVIPVDPYTDKGYFEKIVEMDKVIQKDLSNITLMGIKPDKPTDKYGYIVPESCNQTISKVRYFKEKPTILEAKKLIDEGACWNAGVFGFKLSYMMEILNKNIKTTFYEDIVSRYSEIKKNSFDYEIVEKETDLNMILYEGVWKDLGTWNAVSEEIDKIYGNVIVSEDSKNLTVINVGNVPVVSLGIDDCVIVNAPDGVLVVKKERSNELKKYVENINSRPRYEEKRWGSYKVLESILCEGGMKVLVKELNINKGKSISLQKHFYRDEYWLVLDGEGELFVDEKKTILKKGDTIRISKGQKHMVKAYSNLVVIETQIGEKVIEEDIERF